MNSRITCLALLGLAGLFGTGCNGVRLADNVDLTFDFSRLLGPSDRLHSPYVAGADFVLYATGIDEDEERRIRITSDDPSVMQVVNGGDGTADASAVGTGAVDLLVSDSTGEIHRTQVEVVQPDEARLIAHGPMIIGRGALQPASTDSLRVLVGGSGTFLVRWFADGDRLNGHGALTAEHGDGVSVEPRRSHLFEDREWVTFTAREEGEHEVQLMANGVLTRTITIVGVTDEDIDDVRLHGMDESNADEGEPLVVYAQAYAADETPIYGVEYAWDLNGIPEEGLGDLFRYGYAPGVDAELCARHGELEAVATISATSGFVDSTNRIGCSVGGGGPGWLGGPLAAGLLAVFWTRRRYPRA